MKNVKEGLSVYTGFIERWGSTLSANIKLRNSKIIKVLLLLYRFMKKKLVNPFLKDDGYFWHIH